MEDVLRFADDLGPLKLVHIHRSSIGLKAVVAIDNVARLPWSGPWPPNTFEQTGAARSQIGLPHPPDVTAMLAISMICFGHHDGFPRKIVCRQIRGQFDCLVSSIRVQKIQACVDLPQFHKIQYTLQSC